MGKANNIFIVDDHPVIQLALESVISHQEGLELLGSSSSPEDALIRLAEEEADLIIADFSLGGNDGFYFLHELRKVCPYTPLMLFTVAEESVIGPRAFREGVDGFLMKGASVETIVEAILALLAGNKWASPTLMHLLLNSPNSGPSDILTRRELQVFGLIGEGNSMREIALKLGISPKTVENHREHIKKNLRIGDSVKLQIFARDYLRNLV